jgi:hypothetical protein
VVLVVAVVVDSSAPREREGGKRVDMSNKISREKESAIDKRTSESEVGAIIEDSSTLHLQVPH